LDQQLQTCTSDRAGDDAPQKRDPVLVELGIVELRRAGFGVGGSLGDLELYLSDPGGVQVPDGGVDEVAAGPVVVEQDAA